jgi:hypothetical protein
VIALITDKESVEIRQTVIFATIPSTQAEEQLIMLTREEALNLEIFYRNLMESAAPPESFAWSAARDALRSLAYADMRSIPDPREEAMEELAAALERAGLDEGLIATVVDDVNRRLYARELAAEREEAAMFSTMRENSAILASQRPEHLIAPHVMRAIRAEAKGTGSAVALDANDARVLPGGSAPSTPGPSVPIPEPRRRPGPEPGSMTKAARAAAAIRSPGE